MPFKSIPLCMKAFPCIPLLFAALACADTLPDRAAIERVVGAVIVDPTDSGAKPGSRLFTADADNELDRLLDLDRRLLELSREPWSEITSPRLVIQSIRFVTPDVALVNAVNTHYGSMILARRIPVLFVMKKEGTAWRIASLRVLVDVVSWP
jgi:hypothetical protein